MAIGHDPLQAALDAAVDLYTRKNPKSKAVHDAAVKSLPGGNTRTVLHTDPFPLCVKSGKGYKVTSQDGQELLDLTGEFTAGLYGHSHPVILEAVRHVIDEVGLNVSGVTTHEQLHAEAICSRFGLEQLRFTNSGTEANLHALAAARHFTKKRKIVVFDGGYHGSVLGFPGGKSAANNVDPEDWVVARYNDLESTAAAIRSPGVAAVLLELMQGGAGCINGTSQFLSCIQKTAAETGVLIIADEVITSRMSIGGLSKMRDFKPDLKTVGKWLGGGAAFGAFGGRADIMAAFDPRIPGSLPHSGTFNNNTLAMHVGYAGLTKIYKPEVAEEFTKSGSEFMDKLNKVSAGTKLSFTGCGTVMNVHFTDNGVREIQNSGDIQEILPLKDLLWFEMLESGIWMARRGLMAVILGTPQEELDRFVSCVEAFVAKHRDILAVN